MNKKQTSTFLRPSGRQVQGPRFRSHLPASRCLKVQFLDAFPSRVKNGDVVFQQWPRSSFPGKDKKGHSCVSGPRSWSQGPRLELEKCTTAMAANTALMVPLTLMVTPEGKYYLPSCVQVQSLWEAGELLVQNSPSTWTCGRSRIWSQGAWYQMVSS